MQPLVESLEALEEQLARSTRLLAAAAAADPVAARLMSVPGVGPITALIFKSSIEDPARFKRGEDAGAFAGLVPRRSQSGMRDYKGRISKAGDPMLRHALYEAANSLLVRVKRPCALQTWGKHLAQTKGPKRARCCRAQAGHPAPPPLAIGKRVPLGLTAREHTDRRPKPDDPAYCAAAPEQSRDRVGDISDVHHLSPDRDHAAWTPSFPSKSMTTKTTIDQRQQAACRESIRQQYTYFPSLPWPS